MKRLNPNGELHRMLVEQITSRLQLSTQDMQHYHQAWDKAEELFMAYLPESEADAIARGKRENLGEQQYTTISIPYAYAALLTAHTYYTTILLGRDPVFMMRGLHGESQTAEQCVEALLGYQLSQGSWLVPLYVWLLDVGKYGMGVVGHYWDEQVIQVSRFVDAPKTFAGVPIPGTKQRRQMVEEVPGYTGSRLYNVRPYDFYPDTRKPVWRFQEGEFCGRYVELAWNDLQDGARDGTYFNVDLLETQRPGVEFAGQLFRNRGGARVGRVPGASVPNTALGTGAGNPPLFVPAYEFYWRIRTSDFPGLGERSDSYEVWVFTLAAGDLLIGAQPLGSLSNRYPFEILQYEVDGYNLCPRGMLDTIGPLNDLLDWLINTHFFNVRQTLNNQLVVDPSMLSVKDAASRTPGKLIKVKPAGYGRDVRSMYSQLAVSDVTRSHMADTGIVLDLLQRVPGVTDQVQGLIPDGNRTTATQSRITSGFSINRLKTNTEYFSAMGFAPLGRSLLQSSQQNYAMERSYRIVGDAAQYGERYLNVTPDAIAGFFDFQPVDGTMPVDRYAMATVWQGLLAQAAQFPGILADWDMSKLFGYVASLAGVKNLNSFKLNVQVIDEEKLAMQMQAGNIVPASAVAGPSDTVDPAQQPGMGPTG